MPLSLDDQNRSPEIFHVVLSRGDRRDGDNRHDHEDKESQGPQRGCPKADLDTSESTGLCDFVRCIHLSPFPSSNEGDVDRAPWPRGVPPLFEGQLMLMIAHYTIAHQSKYASFDQS
jgi:hypothetical protein